VARARGGREAVQTRRNAAALALVARAAIVVEAKRVGSRARLGAQQREARLGHGRARAARARARRAPRARERRPLAQRRARLLLGRRERRALRLEAREQERALLEGGGAGARRSAKGGGERGRGREAPERVARAGDARQREALPLEAARCAEERREENALGAAHCLLFGDWGVGRAPRVGGVSGGGGAQPARAAPARGGQGRAEGGARAGGGDAGISGVQLSLSGVTARRRSQRPSSPRLARPWWRASASRLAARRGDNPKSFRRS
jgi:hypothetical protein